MTTIRFALIAVVLGLTACATPRDGGEMSGKGGMLPLVQLPPGLCGGDHHRCIDVHVTAGTIDPMGDQIFDSANHIVFFQITNPASDGYTFPADGITFATTTLPPGVSIPPKNEFTCRPVLAAKVFFCINRNSTTGGGRKIYKYIVKLNGVATPLDPAIMND